MQEELFEHLHMYDVPQLFKSPLHMAHVPNNVVLRELFTALTTASQRLAALGLVKYTKSVLKKMIQKTYV